MQVDLPEQLNIADRFLEARIRDGLGDKVAVLCGEHSFTYGDVRNLSMRVANLLRELGVAPEQRVLICLPDGVEYVASLFGTFAMGGVGVMLNPALDAEQVRPILDLCRPAAVIVHADSQQTIETAGKGSCRPFVTIVVGDADAGSGAVRFEDRVASASDAVELYPTHRDDPALWLFSGGTTGRPKAVVQSHRSFANTTDLYARHTLGYTRDDITLSVPKLFFGYATGSNLLFPFSVGGTSLLFPERCTVDALFQLIRHHRPTILINVPTMVAKMVDHPEAAEQDLSCLRFATSAGEALPVELYNRWRERFGVELLDGLGTAEMWHVFVTNRPGAVKPGTLGQVVEGFDLRVRDPDGNDLPAGEVGALWVRGGSRAWGYWQEMDKTQQAFRGEWYVSGDMIEMDADGYVTYRGRGDDLLKVGGKWLAPGDVENSLLKHAAVRACAVVGVTNEQGLTKPYAFVVSDEQGDELAESLKQHVRDDLEPYKAPREIVFKDELPKTHLGKVDRGALRREVS